MRLAVLSTGRLNPFQRDVLQSVVAAGSTEIVAVVIDTRADPTPQRKLWREIRKRRGGYVLVQTARALLQRGRGPTESAFEWFAERQIPTFGTDDLYAENTRRFLTDHGTDCIFRSGFGIIREPLLSLVPGGVLSYHHGDISRYRGQPPGFWEVYNGESEATATIQVLTPALDAGHIVLVRHFSIGPRDTWKTVTEKLDLGSRTMLRDACELLARDGFRPVTLPDEQLGRLYTTPNLRQWTALLAKVAMRRIRSPRAVA